MKAMYGAFAFAIVVAVVAYFGLNQAGFSTQDQGSGANVRLD